MKHQVRQRLVPIMTAMLAYASWDIIDQRILQPRQPVIGGYVVDWAVAGLAGLTTYTIVQLQKKRALRRAAEQASPTINPLILDHIAQSSRVLNDYLADIQDAIGDSITLEGTQQQRLLRKAMVDVHHAQAILDEMSSLVDTPRTTPPPPEQLIMQQS